MKGIRSRLILYTTTIILIVAASITFFSTLSSREQNINTQRRHALQVTNMIAALIETPLYRLDSAAVRDKLAEIKLSIPSINDIYVLDKEGRVFSDGTVKNPLRGERLPHENAAQLFSRLSIDTDVSSQKLVVGGPILLTGNEALGYIYITIHTTEAQNRLQQTIRSNILIFGLCGLLGIGAAVLFARQLSRPLERLTNAANRIAQGERDVLIRTDGSDEISKLAQALEIMLRRLEDKTIALRTLNTNLDQNVRDRTERLEQQAEELRVARDAAEEANEIKSNFLATMSHELRTPLNGLLGMVGLIATTKLDEKQKNFLDTAQLSGNNLLNLINNILDFSKLGAEKVELENIPFSLPDCLDELSRIYMPLAKHKNLLFGVDLDPHLPQTILGDPSRLKQVLSNLIDNALKFTTDGFVTVQAFPLISPEGPEETEDPKETDTNRNMISFVVSDSGSGIKTARQEQLFQLFTQEDSSMTRKHGGTGLGLAICKQLAELMGGEIGVESDTNIGSRFWFTIPLQIGDNTTAITIPNKPTTNGSEQTMTAEHGDSAPKGDAAGSPADNQSDELLSPHEARILLVEDNQINRELLLAMLSAPHRDIHMAENGALALTAIESTDYDLVLMDISMPVMDGVEATKAIRKLTSSKADVPIVAITANSMPGDKERFIDAGMNDYLSKPVDVVALFNIIHKYAA